MPLDSRVLVLNRSYLPVNVVTARKAFCMVFQDIALILGENMQAHDFASWIEQETRSDEERIGLVDRYIRVPRVLVLSDYNRLPHRHVKFNRVNIYLRDGNRCQYCNQRFPRSKLNLDHVIPRSQGGETSWENVVCSCIRCNRVKGGRSPEQAGMRLARTPYKPNWSPVLLMPGKPLLYSEWKPFLVNASAWSAELAE